MERQRPNGRQILLVEDEPRLREMLLRAMREMGFDPTGAGSAEQALRLLEQQPRPVLIVDLNLPGASGMDLLGTVRRRWPSTQAVILTGFGDLDAARQAIHLDVVDFLTKPCGLGDLEIALGRAFQRILQRDPAAVALQPVKLETAATEHADEGGSPGFHDLHGGGTDEQSDRLLAVLGAVDAADSATPLNGVLEFSPREGSAAMSMEDVERRTILAALEKHNGNRNDTAIELGISLRKLYYRIAQYQKRGSLLP